MHWLLVIILAYFFLGLASLGDRIFLKGKQDPKTYTFYVGALSGLVVLLIPFVNFSIPDINILIWAIIEGVLYVGALYALYYALDRFEVSVVVPIVGGLQPIFIFLITIFVFGFTIVVGAFVFIANIVSVHNWVGYIILAICLFYLVGYSIDERL